ncbi:unnamed protein product [Rhodiola kirilowii]
MDWSGCSPGRNWANNFFSSPVFTISICGGLRIAIWGEADSDRVDGASAVPFFTPQSLENNIWPSVCVTVQIPAELELENDRRSWSWLTCTLESGELVAVKVQRTGMS